VIRLWRNELLALNRAPFDVGPRALFVAYFATAEFSCFLELGWQPPENVLDLYVEHRVETNGEKTICGDGLLGALALRSLGHIDAGTKDEMRRLILDQHVWSDEEKRRILDYCASDVTGTCALFTKMAPSIDRPRALLRGRYMKAVAHMERTGVPVDAALHRQMCRSPSSTWRSTNSMCRLNIAESIQGALRLRDVLEYRNQVGPPIVACYAAEQRGQAGRSDQSMFSSSICMAVTLERSRTIFMCWWSILPRMRIVWNRSSGT
jgi:hypothetical protein